MPKSKYNKTFEKSELRFFEYAAAHMKTDEKYRYNHMPYQEPKFCKYLNIIKEYTRDIKRENITDAAWCKQHNKRDNILSVCRTYFHTFLTSFASEYEDYKKHYEKTITNLHLKSEADKESPKQQFNEYYLSKSQIAFLKNALQKAVQDSKNCDIPDVDKFVMRLRIVITYMNAHDETGISDTQWCRNQNLTRFTVRQCVDFLHDFITKFYADYTAFCKTYKEPTQNLSVDVLPECDNDQDIVELPFDYTGNNETSNDDSTEHTTSTNINTASSSHSKEHFTVCINDVRIEFPQDIDPEKLKSIIKAVREA